MWERRPVSGKNDGDAFERSCKGHRCFPSSTESGEKGGERGSIQDFPRDKERKMGRETGKGKKIEGEMVRVRKQEREEETG